MFLESSKKFLSPVQRLHFFLYRHCRSRDPRQWHQVRHASLIKRPYRPYTFTQLVILSDGSSFTTRTTSPAPVYRSTKDSRNHPLWQPSSSVLRNVEADEAGRLRAFRQRFGNIWDVKDQNSKMKTGALSIKSKIKQRPSLHDHDNSTSLNESEQQKSMRKSITTDNLMDLISDAAKGLSNTPTLDNKMKEPPTKIPPKNSYD